LSRALLAVVVLLAVACGGTSGARQAPPAATNTRAAAAFVTPPPAFEPVRLPRDDAPHDALTEWWYYTGHLFGDDGRRYGFEYVIFQFSRGEFAPRYASHFAVTDSAGQRFRYAERSGTDAIRPAEQGFSLDLDGWTMAGALGNDHLVAAMDGPEGFAIDLRLSTTRPPALHDGDGYVEFGPAGGSYYYSRTRMAVDGTLTVDGRPVAVTGAAWFDHQWGNFLSVGAGGWDWFAVQLESGEDLTVSLVFDEAHEIVLEYGTLVGPDGTVTHLAADELEVAVTGQWTSPHSGATYPARWEVRLPERAWQLELVPSLPDQELRTRASTGVTYWEGEVVVGGTVGGQPVAGLGYVELTGYAR
jgi:predicted secreted hydrolase